MLREANSRCLQASHTMPDTDENEEAAPAFDLVNALCTAVAVLAACGLVWVALTWEPLR
jgi:hypothetical protein